MYLETEAIVLNRRKLSDSDVSLTLFSRKSGRMQVIANGARNPRSRITSACHPFVYGEFSLNGSRDSWRVSQVQITESFYPLREDLNKLALASWFLELSESVLQENQTNNRLFDLLIHTLNMIKTMTTGYNKIQATFELKFFALNGVRPELSVCTQCGRASGDEGWRLDISEGGLICPSCNGAESGYPVEAVLIRLMRFLTESPMETVLKTIISKSLLTKILWINQRYIRHHISDRPFKSLGILKTIQTEGE